MRNFVQKSLCVVSRIPLFGKLERRLKEAVYEHFDCLPTVLQSLFTRFTALCQEEQVPFSGVSYPSLFQSLQQNVLALVKAILHNRSILIYAENSELVSKMVCAIASLLPGFIYGTADPFRFLHSGGYSFSPYVPLQFTDTLNSGKKGYKLMGTCSELFMCQKVVEYDILVDCRKLPPLVQGEALAEFRLTPAELEFMGDLLKYLKENWSTPEAPERIRGEFRKYINSVFTAIVSVRHIRLVPSFTWKYLDWEGTAIFGEKFIRRLVKDPAVAQLVRAADGREFEPVDPRFFVKKSRGLGKQLFEGKL
jgi:hypothetical protein